MIYILKGIIIGLVFGAPVGAIGAMTIQRTLTKSLKAGIITGIGSSVADCFYAAVGVFGVTVISDFMRKRHFIINLLCGFIILFLGISRFVQKPEDNKDCCTSGHLKMFLSSFLLGLMNPVAIMSFMVAFAYLGIADVMNAFFGSMIVLGVFIGTLVWWILLLGLVEHMKKKKNSFSMKKMNQIFGVIFIIFSAFVFFKAFSNKK